MTVTKNMIGDDKRKNVIVSGAFDPVHVGVGLLQSQADWYQHSAD